MAFTSYTSIDAVIKKHKIRWQAGTVVVPDKTAPLFSATFLAELDINLRDLPPARSETGAGEVILFPILREVWKEYRSILSLFTHESLEFDSDLCGYPDYFICPRSEFGPFYPQPPYLLVVEAKLDDFEKAWGQCLAAMLAAQKLNGAADRPVYGIASNGRAWEFGILLGLDFTRQWGPVALATLDILSQSLHTVFRACRDMALAAKAPTPANP